MAASGDNIFIQDAKNTFSSNPVKNLMIPEFEEPNPFAEIKSHLILKAIFKYSKHSTIQVSLPSIMSQM